MPRCRPSKKKQAPVAEEPAWSGLGDELDATFPESLRGAQTWEVRWALEYRQRMSALRPDEPWHPVRRAMAVSELAWRLQP